MSTPPTIVPEEPPTSFANPISLRCQRFDPHTDNIYRASGPLFPDFQYDLRATRLTNLLLRFRPSATLPATALPVCDLFIFPLLPKRRRLFAVVPNANFPSSVFPYFFGQKQFPRCLPPRSQSWRHLQRLPLLSAAFDVPRTFHLSLFPPCSTLSAFLLPVFLLNFPERLDDGLSPPPLFLRAHPLPYLI